MIKKFSVYLMVILAMGSGSDLQAMKKKLTGLFSSKKEAKKVESADPVAVEVIDFSAIPDNELGVLKQQFESHTNNPAMTDIDFKQDAKNKLVAIDLELKKRASDKNSAPQGALVGESSVKPNGAVPPVAPTTTATVNPVNVVPPVVSNDQSNDQPVQQPQSSGGQAPVATTAKPSASNSLLVGAGVVAASAVLMAGVYGLYHWLVGFEPRKNKAALDSIADSIEKIKSGIDGDAVKAGNKALKKLSIVSADTQKALKEAFVQLNTQTTLKKGGQKAAYDECKRVLAVALKEVDAARSIKPLHKGFMAMMRHRISYVWSFIKGGPRKKVTWADGGAV